MEPFHLSYPSSFIRSLVNDSLCVIEEFFDGSKSGAEESIRTEHFVVSVHASIHATSPMRKSITIFREVPLRLGRAFLCSRRAPRYLKSFHTIHNEVGLLQHVESTEETFDPLRGFFYARLFNDDYDEGDDDLVKLLIHLSVGDAQNYFYAFHEIKHEHNHLEEQG